MGVIQIPANRKQDPVVLMLLPVSDRVRFQRGGFIYVLLQCTPSPARRVGIVETVADFHSNED